MSNQTLSQMQLVSCNDADFDKNIKNLTVKDLMGLISFLQKEMAKEQENFNGLSSALNSLSDRKSRQYKTISADMVKAQARLTTLMNRSMKCFSQLKEKDFQPKQNLQQNSQDVQLRRLNSSKGTASPNSSPVKSSVTVHRSRSMHTINQPCDKDSPPTSSSSSPSRSSPQVVPPASGAGRVSRAHSGRVVGQRPASVAGINGVVSPGQRAASTVGGRVSVGYVPPASIAASSSSSSSTSSSLTSLNMTPQAPVMGREERRPRSKSQILITPSPASLPMSPLPASPPSHASPHPSSSSSLTHASSQPSLVASSQSQEPSASPPEKGFLGLPSVKQLAQTFGAKPQGTTADTATNYRPVIRAQSMAASDASHRQNVTSASSSSKVNGVPALTGVGGRVQGQYVKRNAAPKPPSTTSSTVQNGQTELERIHARLQSSRELNLSSLPDKPVTPRAVNGTSSAGQNGEREVSVFKTNLDRKKSSSSIVLGQKTDFDDSLSVAQPAREAQMAPLRKAQSREELYAIESRTRMQKDALLKEIGSRKKSEESEPPLSPSVTMGQWGLKGSSLLAQRLQQDEQEKSSSTPRQNGDLASTRVSATTVQLSSASRGKENGGGGLAVRVRSTSRENLAVTPTDHKISSKPADSSGSSRPQPPPQSSSSSSSSSSSAQPASRRIEMTTAFTKPTTAAASTDDAGSKVSSGQTSSSSAAGEVEEEGEDVVDEGAPRMNLISWDPRPVLNQLYSIQLMEETAEDISHQFVCMEGLMEKLPMNKKKSTLLKTWKRRFFRAKDGWLQYFETGSRDKPSETLQLMGGHVDDMGNRILGIDDGRGHYLMVRAPTDKEHGQWKVALQSQTADNTKATYVRPHLSSPPHPSKHVVVIDMGSGSIRAGILGEKESLPQVMFPSVVAVDRETGRKVVGVDAYHPDVRRTSTLLHPIRPSNRVDKFKIDVDMMTAVFSKVFTELGVNPRQYMVMLSTPQTLSDSLRAGLMEALVGSLGVGGVCMVQQSLLALYSYRATTGIIVDVGQRLEILPICDGFVIEGGVARCPYGAQKVQDSLKKALLETNFKFASEVELLLVQHIMHDCCYVAFNYEDEERLCQTQPGKLKRTINLEKFGLPEGAYKRVDVEEGRFSSPEGFFNVDLWEMDYPTLHKLIFQAIQSCPMDSRRHMYRAVYLSGGVTMLPGFHERLEAELRKLAPPAVTVEVHAAPNRYHAAYLGACSVAAMPQFTDMAISREEWRSQGVKAFRKWQTPAS
ncbi:uncharacterized protein LOC143284892 isoform X2 [Babylonia areolata]|uniref:uncharacterized protein LOC143284892 isoform X2 n=1 Tax=Babylonia areolata TaxID=304850 RepID=UPI003FD5CB91